MSDNTTVFGRFRKRPVEVNAFRWDGDFPALFAWLDDLGYQEDDEPAMWKADDGGGLVMMTLESDEHRCDLGSWVIQGVAGEFYSCRADIFEQTYEAVEPNSCGNVGRGCAWPSEARCDRHGPTRPSQ
jgi:hypothetical protein